MNLTDNAMTILNARYLRKGTDGKVYETPEEMLFRVSATLGSFDAEKAEQFYNLMDSLDFLPNTPTLINAGRHNGQLSACFVLPVGDSMEEIFDAVKYSALIHKTGGGTGFSFSRLRSKGSRVSTTGGEASGVISFMKVFNAATESVKQGGVRRGANMGLLRVDHPDIEDFITCKDDPAELNNFNISVGITDKFITALVMEQDFDLIDPHSLVVVKTVKARDLWTKITHQAWKNGEPGIIFLDTVNDKNPTPQYGDFEATNPCGEQPLLPYESCNLGSINLANHVEDGAIDYEHLKNTVTLGVDFLNCVLEKNHFPLPQIKEATLRTRKIGLGIMGFADMLLKMGIRYDDLGAAEIASRVMAFISDTAREHSLMKGYDNATLTTIAPTGTISMLANVSGGIEPNFAWTYKRISCDKEMHVVHPLMMAKLKEIGQYNDHILDLLAQGTPVSKIPELSGIGDYWLTSQEIDYYYHVLIQSSFQDFVDNAVSKTINLPNDATERTVSNAFMLAYAMSCKGVTVYRDGSRFGQVLSFEKNDVEVNPISEVDACTDDELCELCKTKMERAEGCAKCPACGFAYCG